MRHALTTTIGCLAWLCVPLAAQANGTVVSAPAETELAAPPAADTATLPPPTPDYTPETTPDTIDGWLQPVPFSVDYRLKISALSADFRLELLQESDTDYLVRATTQARGIAKLLRGDAMLEEARFTRDGERLYSTRYVVDGGSKSTDDDSDIRFDWENGSAASVYEEDATTLPLDGEVYDRISADIVIISDLRNGLPPRNLTIAEKNQLRDYEFTFQGEETVEVPAGRFDTLKYLRQRIGSSRSTLIWYAPAADYLPVRMEQLKRGDPVATSVATRISR